MAGVLLYECKTCSAAQKDVHCWLCGQLCVGGNRFFFTGTTTFEWIVREVEAAPDPDTLTLDEMLHVAVR